MLPAWAALAVGTMIAVVLCWLLWPQPKPRDYASIMHIPSTYDLAWQLHQEARYHAPPRIHSRRVVFNVPPGKSVMYLFMFVPSAFAGRGFWRELQPIAVRPGPFAFDFVEPWVTEDHLVVGYE